MRTSCYYCFQTRTQVSTLRFVSFIDIAKQYPVACPQTSCRWVHPISSSAWASTEAITALLNAKALTQAPVAITASEVEVSANLFLLHCGAEVAPELSKIGFEGFLLPSPEHRQVWHSAARFPDNGALQPDAPATLDDETIDGLLTEVRQVISSAKFGSALKVSSRGVFSMHKLFACLTVQAVSCNKEQCHNRQQELTIT